MPIVIQKIRDIDATGVITNHPDQQEDYTWSDLLWGALSVGRRSIMDVFAFGSFSLMELVWRCAMVRSNLCVYGMGRPRTTYFGHTHAFEALDSSEKSAVSYFLGLILAKLAADRKLNVPWLWHLDVYGKLNNPYGPPTRIVAGGISNSRPDLVGRSTSGEWLVCEAKGRSKGVTNEVRTKAKNQTRKISLINGNLPSWRFASIARFSGSLLAQEWIDPEGWLPEAEPLSLPESQLYASYYSTVVSFLLDRENPNEIETREVGGVLYRVRAIPGVNVWLGLDERLFPAHYSLDYSLPIWKELLNKSFERSPNFTVGKDGIYVEIGRSWTSELR